MKDTTYNGSGIVGHLAIWAGWKKNKLRVINVIE
jgi:hypothetical protein